MKNVRIKEEKSLKNCTKAFSNHAKILEKQGSSEVFLSIFDDYTTASSYLEEIELPKKLKRKDKAQKEKNLKVFTIVFFLTVVITICLVTAIMYEKYIGGFGSVSSKRLVLLEGKNEINKIRPNPKIFSISSDRFRKDDIPILLDLQGDSDVLIKNILTKCLGLKSYLLQSTSKKKLKKFDFIIANSVCEVSQNLPMLLSNNDKKQAKLHLFSLMENPMERLVQKFLNEEGYSSDFEYCDSSRTAVSSSPHLVFEKSNVLSNSLVCQEQGEMISSKKFLLFNEVMYFYKSMFISGTFHEYDQFLTKIMTKFGWRWRYRKARDSADFCIRSEYETLMKRRAPYSNEKVIHFLEGVENCKDLDMILFRSIELNK